MLRTLKTKKYRTARNRVKKYKLGVFPYVDEQGLFSILLMHRKVRVLQHICDHILKCPRYFIHRKKDFMYMKLIGCYAKSWLKNMEKDSSWKRM